MTVEAQGRAMDLSAVLTAALEAAADQASRRAREVIMTARLATAVHMRQAAEPTEAQAGPRGQAGDPQSLRGEPAPAQPARRALLMRREGGR